MRFSKHLRLTENERSFIRFRKHARKKQIPPGSAPFLVEAESDLTPERLIALSALLDALCEIKEPPRAVGFHLNLPLEKQHSGFHRRIATWFLWKFPASRPARLFRAVGVSSTLITRTSRPAGLQATEVFARLLAESSKKEDVLKWSHAGLQFGDLLYAHYLRSEKVPTAELDNHRFQSFAIRFIAVTIFWLEKFAEAPPAGVVVANGEYAPGLILRIATLYSLPAVTFSTESFCAVTKNHPNPYRLPFESLRADFAALECPQRDHFLSFGTTLLKNRLEGVLDRELDYVGRSQFVGGSSAVQIDDHRMHNILLAPHGFWESVNALGIGPFSDFWEWLCFVGDRATDPGVHLYIKEHPSADVRDSKILEEFVRKFPEVRKINGHISHHELVAQGIKLVVTDHGTIGTEYPALGVPVLAVSPWAHYRDWDFTFTPNSLNSFKDLILNPPSVDPHLATLEIAEYFAARRWALHGDGNLFFPPGVLEGFAPKDPALLDCFIRLHTDEDYRLLKASIKNFLSFLDENPDIAVFQTGAFRREFH